MKAKLYLVILVMIISSGATKASDRGTIDTVYSFKPGAGQSIGQGPEFYPKNIFGRQAANAEKQVPASADEDVLSLGFGGEIIVGFRGKELVDGPGDDFIIFENPFYSPVKKKVFAEPGVVSVSEDGINFIEFPFDSLTLKGCAGLTPVNGKAEMFDTASGGDRFDLAAIGLKSCKYIKIRDISKMVLDNPSHPYYDPTISGFDLDAVGGMYLTAATSVEEDPGSMPALRIADGRLFVENPGNVIYAEVYDISGALRLGGKPTAEGSIPGALPGGIYLVKLRQLTGIRIYKVML